MNTQAADITVGVVLIAIAVVFAPLVAALAFASPGQAVVTAIGFLAVLVEQDGGIF